MTENQQVHPAGSLVSQGFQMMEQFERSYKRIYTQHFKSRTQQSGLSQPVSPVSTFLVHSSPSCHVDPKILICLQIPASAFPLTNGSQFPHLPFSPPLLQWAFSWSPCLPIPGSLLLFNPPHTTLLLSYPPKCQVPWFCFSKPDSGSQRSKPSPNMDLNFFSSFFFFFSVYNRLSSPQPGTSATLTYLSF